MNEGLRPHQWEAMTKIGEAFEKNNAFLLADSLGLGKTRVACEAAKRFGKVLIVAPLSTFGGWLNESEVVGLNITTAGIFFPPSKAVLINYERLEKYTEVGHWDDKIFKACEFDLLIWDESHRLKGLKTNRAKLFQGFQKTNAKMLFLTGTPGQSPLDLCYLGNVIGFKDRFWPWVREFKCLKKNPWGGLDYKPSKCTSEAVAFDKAKLSSVVEGNPYALRRVPSQIAGWPELNRVIFPIRLNARQNEDYNRAFEDYLDELEVEGKKLNQAFAALVAAGQFRKRISFIKTEATIQHAMELLEQGHVVTIGCEYVLPAHDITNALRKLGHKVGCITGETSSRDRLEILAASSQDALDVIVFTPTEGINLHQIQDGHRTRVQIDHDVRWSGLAQTQMDGRTHRAGRSALVYWMVCSDSIDERVAKVMKDRLDTIKTINGDFMIDATEYISRKQEVYA